MPADLTGVFAALKPICQAHQRACVVLRDAPGTYHLGSQEVRAKDGYRTTFGGLDIGKRYVSAHLMPVYVHPDLLDGISNQLRRRMQGKSCFNFTTVDARLFAEFKMLVDTAVDRFKADGRL
jgi:hypothetical protein